MINWQTVTLNLRTHYKPLSTVAKEVGSDWAHLNRLARGDVKEPKFSTACKILDLHLIACPKLHNLKLISI